MLSTWLGIDRHTFVGHWFGSTMATYTGLGWPLEFYTLATSKVISGWDQWQYAVTATLECYATEKAGF